MRVAGAAVVMPENEFESWTVLGDDQVPVRPVERFLAYLASIEQSPNTIKAYAHDLKDWFVFLAGHGRDWRSVTLEDVAGFVAWLRLPPQARDGRVAVLPTVAHHCSRRQREPQARGVDVVLRVSCPPRRRLAGLLVTMHPVEPARLCRQRRYKPFLHHVTKTNVNGGARSQLTQPRLRPKVLTVKQVQTILDACEHLRDRLLFALLLDTGVRIGEALGLRHEDLDDRRAGQITVRATGERQPRPGQGRPVVGRSRPAPELMRLYVDYLNGEYGALDSDYVFVNLWSEPNGRPLAYPAVYDLVRRLRAAPASTSDPTSSVIPTRHGCCAEAPEWKA